MDDISELLMSCGAEQATALGEQLDVLGAKPPHATVVQGGSVVYTPPGCVLIEHCQMQRSYGLQRVFLPQSASQAKALMHMSSFLELPQSVAELCRAAVRIFPEPEPIGGTDEDVVEEVPKKPAVAAESALEKAPEADVEEVPKKPAAAAEAALEEEAPKAVEETQKEKEQNDGSEESKAHEEGNGSHADDPKQKEEPPA